MKHFDKIENFYNSLKDIETRNSDLDDKRESLKKEVYSYNEKIQKLSINKSLQKQNKDIGELLNLTLHIIKDSSKI